MILPGSPPGKEKEIVRHRPDDRPATEEDQADAAPDQAAPCPEGRGSLVQLQRTSANSTGWGSGSYRPSRKTSNG